MLNKSPLAPEHFPEIQDIAGMTMTALQSGERYRGRKDVLIAAFEAGTTSAAVFTQSLTPGAPVTWSREVHASGTARAMIVTAGNANVCTGRLGMENTRLMARGVGQLLNLDDEQVFVSSTGVIGEQLDAQKILESFPADMPSPDADQDWLSAASAIMTTDTYPKAAGMSLQLGGKTVTISGIAKGSGMIEPDMATMLSYIFTDANIEAGALQAMLSAATERSFNSITVDSDTSTSDTCLLFATGKAGNACITDLTCEDAKAFYAALESVMTNLAQQIIRDGEGAQKFITVRVTGAESNPSAKHIARSIANSPLVKTAIAGEDANWGRIVMAVGKAGQPIDFEALKVSVGSIVIAEGDGPVETYDESLVQAHIEGHEVDIDVDVGLNADGRAVVWTCDLTHGYIDINADYRS